MIFLYTARVKNDKKHNKDWYEYLKWSGLTHLTELVSLDEILNRVLFELDYDNLDDQDFIYLLGQYHTNFFISLDYVLKKVNSRGEFNLLAVVIEPDQECENIKIDNFEFMGYELLDKDFGISALTNCGGFDETFLPIDLNDKGLIEDFSKAQDIKKRLLENNSYEPHANTNIIAVWRHKTIG